MMLMATSNSMSVKARAVRNDRVPGENNGWNVGEVVIGFWGLDLHQKLTATSPAPLSRGFVIPHARPAKAASSYTSLSRTARATAAVAL